MVSLLYLCGTEIATYLLSRSNQISLYRMQLCTLKEITQSAGVLNSSFDSSCKICSSRPSLHIVCDRYPHEGGPTILESLFPIECYLYTHMIIGFQYDMKKYWDFYLHNKVNFKTVNNQHGLNHGDFGPAFFNHSVWLL